MAALGAVAAIVGSIFGYQGQKEQAAAVKKAEKARRSLANMEANRRRREILRQQQVLLGRSLNTAANQGAQFSSALSGAQAQITATGQGEQRAVTSNIRTANRIFEYNQDYAKGGEMIALGQGISSIGGSIGSALPALGRQFNFAGSLV